MSNEKSAHTKPPKSGKKPYRKPSFKHEKVFETMALACGKTGPTSSGCQHVKKTS